MIEKWKASVWQQFGASLKMFENAINACPEDIWGDRSGKFEYWYAVYHTLFWLDFFMSDKQEDFAPPEPFNLDEMDPAGILPDRVYTKDEMLNYLEHGRRKCRARIESLTEKSVHEHCPFDRPDITNIELMMYMMRHVQHHTAQLNLRLRQTIDSAPLWVGKVQ